MRRWISFGVAVLTSAVVVVGAQSGSQAVGPCANTGSAVFGGGNGSASTPYLIATTAHLVALSDDANSDTWGCHFTQTANIDLSSVSDWRPIGNRNDSENVPFRGSYDGGGFTISNLNITVAGITIAPSTYQYNAGLFGLVRYATLKNITLVDAIANTTFIDNANNGDYTATAYQTGLLAGTIESSLIGNITISGGTLTLTPATDHGAIAGQAEASMLESLRVDGLQMIQDVPSASSVTETVGAVIGRDDSNDLVANVVVENVKIDINTTQTCRYIGGVTGRVSGLTNYEVVTANVDIALDCDAGIEIVGGAFGEFDSDGARLHDAELSASIVGASLRAVNIGGVVGLMDGVGSQLSEVMATTSVSLVTKNEYLWLIGGLVGQLDDGVISDVTVVSTLNLTHLGDSNYGDYDQISHIGGAFGDADESLIRNLVVNTTIGIDSSQAEEPTQVEKVGGVIGMSGNASSFRSILANSAITVSSSEAAHSIGGVIGYFTGSRDATSQVQSQRFIDSTSTISVTSADASTNATCGGTCNVGGFSGDAYPSLTDSVITAAITASSTGVTEHIGGLSALNDTGSSRPQLFKRVVVRSAVPTVPQSAVATTSHLIGADVSYFEGLNVPLSVSEGVLFDSSIAGTTSAGNGQPGTAATTAQLADVAFLTSQGYDTDKVWCVVGGRPGIRDVTPGCTTAVSSMGGSAGVIRARVRVPITPQVVALSSGTGTTFTVSPALPAGVVLNAQTGMLSGTPRAILAPTTFTVTATTGEQTSTSTFTLQVGKRPKFLAEVADRARGVVFAQNSTKLTTSAKRSLRKMLPRLRNAERVVIQGHVSVRESQSSLQARRLSYRRAMVVKRYLERRGVTVDVVTGYTVRRPSRVNDTRTPRATVFWLNP